VKHGIRLMGGSRLPDRLTICYVKELERAPSLAGHASNVSRQHGVGTVLLPQCRHQLRAELACRARNQNALHALPVLKRGCVTGCQSVRSTEPEQARAAASSTD
jgi:hypothetical protein